MKLRRKRDQSDPKPARLRRQRPGVMETFKQGSKPPRRRAAEARARGGISGTLGGPTPAAPAAGGKRGPRGGRDGAAPGGSIRRPELVKERETLSKRFAELQWDLGGIAYEMGKRNRFKRSVLVKRAEELKKVDAELGQIERVLHMEQEGAAGTCPHCGALQARGAVYCWKCGKQVTAKSKNAKPKASGTNKASSSKTGGKARRKSSRTRSRSKSRAK